MRLYFGVVVTKVVVVSNHNVGFERLSFAHFHLLHEWVVDDWPLNSSHMSTSYFGGRGLAQIHIWVLDSSQNVLTDLRFEVGEQEREVVEHSQAVKYMVEPADVESVVLENIVKLPEEEQQFEFVAVVVPENTSRLPLAEGQWRLVKMHTDSLAQGRPSPVALLVLELVAVGREERRDIAPSLVGIERGDCPAHLGPENHIRLSVSEMVWVYLT